MDHACQCANPWLHWVWYPFFALSVYYWYRLMHAEAKLRARQ